MSILLAILGLGFLIFIHELGHYFMAKKVGMKVEAFSIGFGKPFLKWERKGVQWRLCYLPFGGYVKIAGMQKEGNKEAHEIEGGFFSKTPWQRIQVAFMGPLVNMVFAFLAFTALWVAGGRIKPFSQFTKRIGYLQETTELYQKGVRPGDEIRYVEGKPYTGYQDLLYTMLVSQGSLVSFKGYEIDYPIGRKIPFSYESSLGEMDAKGMPRLFIFPAQYLFYAKEQFLQNSPLEKTGIQEGDRLFWVNGELVFSSSQVGALLNESTAFLTVERNGSFFHSKMALAKLEDFRLDRLQEGELDDWRHEAKITSSLKELYFLPYFFKADNTISERIDFIDRLDQKRAFSSCRRCPYFHPLQEGDKVVAVNGERVFHSFDLLKALQKRKSLMIVERDPSLLQKGSWKQADKNFDPASLLKKIKPLVQEIGTGQKISSSGNFVLLEPFVPLKLEQIKQTPAQFFSTKLSSEERRVFLENYAGKAPSTFILGTFFQDKQVQYNPDPFSLFSIVVKDMGKTFSSLFRGQLKAKYLAGPVGILHMVQQSWLIGFKEALFWLGLISLNLAILNLLPIPILDGGHVVLSFFEMFRKKRISPKTLERMMLPFFVLMVFFFVYVTYHDVFRLISSFFS